MADQRHICGACGNEYPTDADYCAHVCEATGKQADTIDHLDVLTGGEASQIAVAALARGEARKEP